MNYKLRGACDSRTSMHGVLTYYITRSSVYCAVRLANSLHWNSKQLRQQLAVPQPVASLRFPTLTNAGDWRNRYLRLISER